MLVRIILSMGFGHGARTESRNLTGEWRRWRQITYKGYLFIGRSGACSTIEIRYPTYSRRLGTPSGQALIVCIVCGPWKLNAAGPKQWWRLIPTGERLSI